MTFHVNFISYEETVVKNTSHRMLKPKAILFQPHFNTSCLSAIWVRLGVMKWGGREAPIRNVTSDEGYKLFQVGKHNNPYLCDKTSLVSVTTDQRNQTCT